MPRGEKVREILCTVGDRSTDIGGGPDFHVVRVEFGCVTQCNKKRKGRVLVILDHVENLEKRRGYNREYYSQ